MIDHARASELAKTGFERWQSGLLDDAARCYAEAVVLADPEHYATPDYRGQYANVLSALGRDEDVLIELRQALALEEAQSGAGSPGASVARYFLGEHFLKMARPADALNVVTMVAGVPGQRAILALVEALAGALLGDAAGARMAAPVALTCSSSPAQRERIAARLSALGEAG